MNAGRAEPVAAKRLRLVAASLALACLPVLCDADAISRAVDLGGWPADALWSSSWAAYGLLWVWAPVVFLSACLLLLSPGVLASLWLSHRCLSAADLVARGFTLSVALISISVEVIEEAYGGPIRGGRFCGLVLVLCVPGLIGLVRRRRRGLAPALPRERHDGHLVASLLVSGFVLAATFAPKLYWEAFNGDGAHAFESARLLLTGAVPFWSPDSGTVSSFPGASSFLFTYPLSWFVRLFGEHEASVRLPALFFLLMLHASIVRLVAPVLGSLLARAIWLLWPPLSATFLALAYSATYSPYSADIALPATQDLLVIVWFLGFAQSIAVRNTSGALVFGMLTHFTAPNGFLLLLLFGIAGWRFLRARDCLQPKGVTLALGLVLAAGAAIPLALRVLGLPEPGQEYSISESLVRFAFLQFNDWRRVLFAAVPLGFLPLAALSSWWRQDPLSRVMTVVSVSYFALFYVQAHVALHHFVPCMLLPLVVFWRHPGFGARHQKAILTALTALGATVGVLLSLPAIGRPFTDSRDVGSALEVAVPGYARSASAVFEASDLLAELLPLDWDPRVPAAAFGGSPLVWLRYGATRAWSEPPAYRLQPADAPPPSSGIRVASNGRAELWVLDQSRWAAHLALRPRTPPGAAVYRISRGILFRSVPLDDGTLIIDLPHILGAWGVDVERLRNRLEGR